MKKPSAKQPGTLEVHSRDAWRKWLSTHHASESDIWLVFRKGRRPGTLDYEAAVEEALCFGWIDSLIKRLDEARYARRFTPRTSESVWSPSNRRRYAKVKAAGLLTPAGVSRSPTARGARHASGTEAQVVIRQALKKTNGIERALKANRPAWHFFQSLRPPDRQRYVIWIATARRDDTRQRRVQESIDLLAAGRKLGLK